MTKHVIIEITVWVNKIIVLINDKVWINKYKLWVGGIKCALKHKMCVLSIKSEEHIQLINNKNKILYKIFCY